MDKTYNLNGAFKPPARRTADTGGPDFYPTPTWATHALIANEPFEGDIWEPACGNGAMAEALATTGNHITSTDLYDHGYGQPGVDFLKAQRRVANVITNPPYNSAEGFVEVGLRIVERKFALLLRLAFLEGANRAKTIFSRNPPSRVWVFSERVTFYPKGTVAGGSGTTAYGWFVWDKAHAGPTELMWLKPGFKPSSRKSGGQE